MFNPKTIQAQGCSCPMPPRTKSLGFTLIELMVTIAVLAIIMGIAVPSFMSTIVNARLTTAANDLLAAIQLTRTEAIRTHGRITLCKATPTANQCDTSAASDWGRGWMVFTDPVTQSPPQVEGTSRIVSRGGGQLSSDLSIKSGATDLQLYISFTGDGSSRQMNGNFLAGTIRICSTSSFVGNDDRARDIVINSAGRATIQRPTGIPASCPAP
jgi:type IV fimbrial biogenesis protein FimT